MMIENAAKKRGVEEVLHFTTNEGLLGILHADSLMPNAMLKEEQKLEFIFKQNSKERKERDIKWLTYINFSITKINKEFFSYSKNRRNGEEIFWVVLAFNIGILDHPGVFFTTTNNIYPSNIRKEGLEGFENMFASVIEGKFQASIARTSKHLPSWTTCEQAEVLYPGTCSTRYLMNIYVKNDSEKHIVKAMLAALEKNIDVVVKPEMFVC